MRRDETEHLILIGGGQDLVIESGISLNSSIEEMREPPRAPIPIRQAPRAPVFGGERRPVAPPRRAADDVAAQLRARRELRREAFSSVYG